MKRQLQQYIASLGGTTAYAGNTEKWTLNKKGDEYDIKHTTSTMFIKGLKDTPFLRSNVNHKIKNAPLKIVFQ